MLGGGLRVSWGCFGSKSELQNTIQFPRYFRSGDAKGRQGSAADFTFNPFNKSQSAAATFSVFLASWKTKCSRFSLFVHQEASFLIVPLLFEGIDYVWEVVNMELEWKPRIGMDFDSMNSAWKFWSDYGGRMGFGVRKDYSNKSKKDGSISSCRFVCHKEGSREKHKNNYLIVNPRREMRTDCKARICFSFLNGKFRVKDFVEEHNHELHHVETTHMIASQRHMSDIQQQEIELADDSGIQQRASYTLMSKHVGGRVNLGYTRLDQKNYLRTRRQKSLEYGEAGCLLRYFEDQQSKNPAYFQTYLMDSEEQITNIFWADARMRLDYGYFDDVVSLDTTYCTNNAHRPLALFSGFNHHRGVVLFLAALLYDQIAASFKWLFETFLKVHNKKKPQTIFTDQDQAMAKALQEVLSDTYHGLCTWHLMQNSIKHLGNLMKHGSHFLRDFKTCMYGYEEETEFETAWREWKVLFYPYDKTISCTCRKFETWGILCCHALKVFEAYDVKKLPDQYILKRWTKEARTGIIYDAKGNEIEDDSKLGRTLQYNSLCHELVNIASEVAGKDEEVSFIRMVMHEAMKKVMECRLEKRHETNERDDPIPLSRIDMPQPTGIKKRAGSKRRTRIKSRVELRHRNGKASKSMSQPIITLSQSEQSTDIGASSQMQFENPFSFTKLLMDQSEGPNSLGGPKLGGDKL
ncbi:protein FAR1-RELATED SEQUENCE 5-like [Senna tora]|uniref:Protein FAR1-RELATED SEQUENCE 5-like n=1 Tax=Senna tora TaxID=362788 RepID=A0A835C8E9_9FABA|nr:protein FAR1-RELATED SEQUENCE 5-like [Senna tora]